VSATRVAVNGYGVIGKRVADAVVLQDDMEFVGVADIAADYRLSLAAARNIPLFGSTADAAGAMTQSGSRRPAPWTTARPSRRRGRRHPEAGGRSVTTRSG
jgi:hypothetical protein